MKKFVTFFLMLAVILPLAAQTEKKDDRWKFSGYAVIIPYLDGRDFSNNTHPIFYTTMKLRAGLEKSIGNFLFKMQIQNSRIFGEEAAITSNKNPIFLIEGFLKFDSLLDIPLSFQAGRFQLEYGTGRYIGVSPWNYIERTYDGFKTTYKKNRLFLDVFALKHTTLYVPPPFNATPEAFSYPEKDYSDYDIIGFWYGHKFGEAKEDGEHDVNLFTFWEADAKKADTVNMNLSRFTSGFTYYYKLNDFTATAELGYQFGKKAAKDVAAYLASVKVDYKMTDFNITAGADLHSGTSPTEKNKVQTFDNYLAGKHRFMGFMDYFTNARNSYNLVGVNDFYAGFDYDISKEWKLNLTGHYFMANQKSATNLSDYGQEFDITLKYNVQKGIFVEWVNGLFLPGDLMKEFFKTSAGVREDPSFASYLRFVAKI